jgi:aminopeptidase YwaD
VNDNDSGWRGTKVECAAEIFAGLQGGHVKRLLVVAMVMGSGFASSALQAQKPPLLPEKDVAALANELSGETAKRNLEGLARFHRQRGSRGFHEAAELVAERARAYGLSDVAILQFPADGKIFYGTQRSRPAWDAEKGELEEVGKPHMYSCGFIASQDGRSGAACDGVWFDNRLLASYEAEPIVLAEDSESADVTAELVDVGEGTKESDYAGKYVKGKIVLVSVQPGAVQDLAVGKFGAAGIVSYAQNQKTAWWGEDENLIRWGHLETFSANKTFGFMVSLKTARAMRERLAKGEKITLHAVVKAGQHAGNYDLVTATIPGADPKLKEEEIAFSCHLDHQRPGANDNASGCVTILEVARTLQKLINEGKLARPARTIQFIFPPEIEGTMALLNARHATYSLKTTIRTLNDPVAVEELKDPVIVWKGQPLTQRIKAVVHMDMVGGGPETKAVFHVTRGPMSLPSFVHDVAWAFAEFVNEESYKFAATGAAKYPFAAPEGGKEPLRAEYSAYTMGSDHDVYQDSSFGIPTIYLNDWPDRYIHTNFDTAANIDPTKLKRAAFIGAASGYFLAQFSERDERSVFQTLSSMDYTVAALRERRFRQVSADEGNVTHRYFTLYIETAQQSVFGFLPDDGQIHDIPHISHDFSAGIPPKPKTAEGLLVFKRRAGTTGPLAVFGYDYFAEHAKAAGLTTPKLLSYEGLWGEGEEYAYEVLNFADEKRNAGDVRNAVSAEYGPVPLEMVVEYLKALEKIGIVEEVK